MGTTEKLAAFVVNLKYDHLPPEAVVRLKRQCLDTIGVGLAAVTEATGRIINRYVERVGGAPECTLLGSNFKSSPAEAAFANGTLCHALDYDDVWYPTAHPTGVTLPATLAMAEAGRVSGRDLIIAQMAAYEIMGKLHMAITSGAGWHGTPIFGSFGATAGCCKLLNMDERALCMAWGIAASTTSGVAGQLGTMTKPLHSGNSARVGVMAASLAAGGFTSNQQIFDDPRGFFNAFYGSEGFDLTRVTFLLGNPFHLLSPGVGVKMYPSGYYMHHPFEAALQLVQQHEIRPRDVADVEVGIPRAGYFDRPVIQCGLEGKFSQQYHVAMAILDQKLEIESFSDKRALAPDVQEFLKKIKVRVDSSIPSARDLVYNPVTIRLTDGRNFTAKQDLPKSHWRYPLKREDWLEKFRNNAARALPDKRVERIIELVDKLEQLSDVRELTHELAGES
ncbi:MAG: MmgE/PrpD family protein [Deltaproteobacteria bacterium]|nr:MmgE/PrpD family protein [Deltaproteobacteria bacterium]